MQASNAMPPRSVGPDDTPARFHPAGTPDAHRMTAPMVRYCKTKTVLEEVVDHSLRMDRLRRRAAAHFEETGRPFVTLSFAQSLDGSIAAVRGRPMALSCPASRAFTHHLRAVHRSILVGIGTVLADDPRLNVRLAEGDHPRPVVLDTRLRFPLEARMLRCPGPTPLILTTVHADPSRESALARAGAEVVRLPADRQGRVSLDHALDELGRRGVDSVMVEGGGEVITSFLRGRRVDRMVVTIAFVLVGGMPAVGALRGDDRGAQPAAESAFPRLRNVSFERVGDDMILSGDPAWDGRRDESASPVRDV